MTRHGGALAQPKGNAPFPTRQMAILALCRICEPIAFMSIFPYAYFMVESFGIAKDKAHISMYVGMVTSAFAFAECLSGVFWGRLSDRIGRKKVLLGGLFGTGLSMLLFGFAQTLPMALLARALGGLLNGNIGVLQTTVAELVTVEEHQPRAYSIMPFVWCIGTIIGASLGGLLAQPAKSFPSLFEGSIFETYPYLLPNLVCTAVVVCGLIVGILFLEETHDDRKNDKDRGREAGQWILRKVWRSEMDAPMSDKDGSLDEMRSMLEDHAARSYSSTSSSPTLCSSRTSMAEPPRYCLDKEVSEAPKLRAAFTKQVCLNIVGYGILAFHTISLEQLLPILMSRKQPKEDLRHMPFHFKGGFQFTPQTIGALLAVQGALQMFAQVILFPWISKRLGSLRTFWLTIATYPFLYMVAPYLALLPEHLRIPGIILLLVWKVTAQSLSYPSLAIMLANAAPSKKVLGTLNGAAASSASVCRGFGPTVSGAVDTFGDSLGMSGLAWWTCAGIAAIGWVPGFLMKEERRRPGFCGVQEDEEAGFGEALADSDSDVDSVITLTPDQTVDAVLSKK
ncbi:major facilitator superfamily domain-containing protein [Massariosphaeria phaeospora]|uniref:Major facilitator superfamily domain-containing protein n=1 Tax=Massariosphaeria phaeospora TaxID=100035 RepID=A0A7C8MTL9_9PLEO|nr:major facilitator superfamily domain-containing protein [Massariosphaeria phaeospora]